MPTIFDTPLYPYERRPDQDKRTRHQVVVVGAGPVGLATAIDLAQRGTDVVIIDDNDKVSTGSRAICFAKRSLEICDRLGIGKAMRDKGVVWSEGKVFFGDRQIYEFNLLQEDGHKAPAFVNLQQYHVENMLLSRVRALQAEGAALDIRGKNRFVGLTQHHDYVEMQISTPDGPYILEADWLVACDGAGSSARQMLNLDFNGQIFEDNFLIADVKMKADFPTERWFWFEPPFRDAGQSALLHKQPDDVWRIDFQLGWDIDRERELEPDRIRARVDSMLSTQSGKVPDYEVEWSSIYTFQCRRMDAFRHGHVLFAGDSAHQVSPFGARGANSGIQDADNLAWKLHLVCEGLAEETLLDSYAEEREYAADENILNSTRSTDFMTPKSGISKTFRDAVLQLAERHAFARPLVNSGRLSVPCVYAGLPSFGPDELGEPLSSRPGAACPDAPLDEGYLLEQLAGFTILAISTAARPVSAAGQAAALLQIDEPCSALSERYLGGASQAVYLIRPDQHVVARWPAFDQGSIVRALKTVIGRPN